MHQKRKIQTERFLHGKANAREAKDLIKILNNELAKEELMNEWKQLECDELDKDKAFALSHAILEIEPEKKPVERNWMKAAAILIILSGGCWLWWLTKPITPSADVVPKIAANEMNIINNSTQNEILLLEDGSTVTLYPNSSLKYNKDSMAAGAKRNIYLDGGGRFDVAKDSKRPFTVYSSTLYTTALGTSFEVKALADYCTVKLFSGKVVIGNANGSGIWEKPVYLLPGETVDIAHHKTNFRPVNKNEKIPVMAKTPETKNTHLLRFNNTSLQDVFSELEKKYNYSIKIDSSIGKHRFFTGELLPGDSLPVVMKIICSMNKLQCQDSSGVWIVKP